jgi:hypothetical protein
MNFIRIFEVKSPIEQGLFTIPGDGESEYELFFTKMSDPELVRSICSMNWKIITMTVSGTIEELANDISELAAGLEQRLFDCQKNPQCTLDDLFRVTGSLGDHEEGIQTCVSISETIKSFLPYPELYALRYSPNHYLVTGGRICLPGSPDEGKAIKEVEEKWMDVYNQLLK